MFSWIIEYHQNRKKHLKTGKWEDYFE